MAGPRDVNVPDIGDFTDVPVIEILVAEGDEVAVEQPLVTLESDKATMDVPAPFAGRVAELKVSVGDEVSEGSVLMVVEATNGELSGEQKCVGVSAVRGAGVVAAKSAAFESESWQPPSARKFAAWLFSGGAAAPSK